MVNRSELYRQCVEIFEKSGIADAEFDTLCIFQDMLNDKNPLFRPLEAVPEEAETMIRKLAQRRAEGYPLQYLLGQWEFFGYPFFVGEGVLIPRPETELLVENVIEICRKNNINSPKIADLCAGSGCIAITLKKELPQADVYAYEISEKAFGYMEKNIELNGADIKAVKCDVCSENIAADGENFDIIVSNPPYLTKEEMQVLQKEVTFEPQLALDGGSDGLDCYRNITEIWKKRLKKGGWLCYEFGDGQHEKVEQILIENKFANIKFSRDLAGIVRTVTAQKSEEL